MSVNGAEPTGEVKKEIEEPILGDNGVNYDVYAENFVQKKTPSEDTFFDSKEYAKRQKTELITNVKGADRIKREEERREAADEKRKLKTLRKEVQQEKIISKETPKKNKSDEKAFVRKYKRTEFLKKHGKKIAIAIILLVILSTAVIAAVVMISGAKEEQQTREEIATSLSYNVKSIDEAREHYGTESEAYYEAVQKLINEAKHNENKARLLLLRAEDLASTGDPELIKKALEDAYAAEKYYPSIESAYRIETIERTLGNEEKANEYGAIKEERARESGGAEGEG